VDGSRVSAQPSDIVPWVDSHTFQIVATLSNYDTLSATSDDVTVVITNPCTETEIDTTQVISALQSTIEGETVTRTFQVFPNSADVDSSTKFGTGKCGLQEYSITMDDVEQSAVPDFLTLNEGSRTLTLDASNLHDDGTYDILLHIKMTEYPTITATKAIQVVIGPCEPSITTTTSVDDVTYEVGREATVTTAFAEYDITPECEFSFTYSASLENDNALPSFITFDPAARTFSVETNDVNNAGEYTVKITATLNDVNTQTDDSVTFKVTVTAICRQDEVSVLQSVDDFTYVLSSTAADVSKQATFSQTHADCPSSLSITVDGSELSPTDPVVEFNSETGEVTIGSTDVDGLDGTTKTIVVKKTSTLSESATSSAEETFVVSFRDACHDTIISAVTFDTTEYTFKLYES
jgi:hypothetical protein